MLISYDFLVKSKIKKIRTKIKKNIKYGWRTRDFKQNTLRSLIFKNNIIHTIHVS